MTFRERLQAEIARHLEARERKRLERIKQDRLKARVREAPVLQVLAKIDHPYLQERTMPDARLGTLHRVILTDYRPGCLWGKRIFLCARALTPASAKWKIEHIYGFSEAVRASLQNQAIDSATLVELIEECYQTVAGKERQ